ncbi:MAG: NAD(P)H-dependent oxidoreductase [Ruminococcus sp.]|jgi:chromate reductase|nr:NAD(P)H-dependent oxidoreductase [Ruminococcus sp.]
MPKNLYILTGSLRKNSYSSTIAKELANMLTEFRVHFADWSDLPIYNQDLDDNPPQEWTAFRNELKTAEAFLFVTPEYNRGIPGGLKNAIDIGSRPMVDSIWNGKPCGIVSVSPGKTGGYGANHQLRSVCTVLNMPTLQQPEAYLSIAGQIDDTGKLTDNNTRNYLKKFAADFADFVNKF